MRSQLTGPSSVVNRNRPAAVKLLYQRSPSTTYHLRIRENAHVSQRWWISPPGASDASTVRRLAALLTKSDSPKPYMVVLYARKWKKKRTRMYSASVLPVVQ